MSSCQPPFSISARGHGSTCPAANGGGRTSFASCWGSAPIWPSACAASPRTSFHFATSLGVKSPGGSSFNFQYVDEQRPSRSSRLPHFSQCANRPQPHVRVRVAGALNQQREEPLFLCQVHGHCKKVTRILKERTLVGLLSGDDRELRAVAIHTIGRRAPQAADM